MKKVLVNLTLALCVFLASGAYPVFASTAGSGNGQIPDNVFTLEKLGYNDQILLSPYGSARVVFGLPPTWQLSEGGKILVRYTFSSSNQNTSEDLAFGGALFVYFNDELVGTIYMEGTGQFSKEIALPLSALQTESRDNRHFVSFVYDATNNCENENYSASLVIDDESEISFAYTVAPPTIDLSKFPLPLFQQSGFSQNPAMIIIPDRPSAIELQAALSVSAGLGSLTLGNLNPELVTLGNLPDERRGASNLIFVGLPTNLQVLQNLSLPVPVTQSGLTGNGVKEEDGVVQMALSPWNQERVVMLVSGNTEKGLIKAAAIVGSGEIFTSGRPDVAIVSDVNISVLSTEIPDSRTFSDLGYEALILGDQGDQYAAYSFYVSAKQASTDGAYIDLTTLRSDLLNTDQSGFSLFLNGNPIASLKFEEEASVLATKRIDLLPNVLIRGNNLLEIFVELRPKYNCYSQDLQGSWITLSETSLIVTPSEGPAAPSYNSNLQDYPIFLLTADNLSDTAIIVPENDPLVWSQASSIAHFLGNSGNLRISEINVLFGNQISEEILMKKNLLVIGRASALPFVGQINDALPAPYEAGSDEAIQPAMLINYRLLPGVSVGYLQLLVSPWNPDRTILVAMGNSDAGVQMASNSLIQGDLLSKISGNFTVIYNDQVLATDTRLGQARDSIVGQLPIVVTVTPVPENASNSPNPAAASQQTSSNWIPPVLAVIFVLVVGLAIFVIRNRLVDWKLNKGHDSQADQEKGE